MRPMIGPRSSYQRSWPCDLRDPRDWNLPAAESDLDIYILLSNIVILASRCPDVRVGTVEPSENIVDE